MNSDLLVERQNKRDKIQQAFMLTESVSSETSFWFWVNIVLWSEILFLMCMIILHGYRKITQKYIAYKIGVVDKENKRVYTTPRLFYTFTYLKFFSEKKKYSKVDLAKLILSSIPEYVGQEGNIKEVRIMFDNTLIIILNDQSEKSDNLKELELHQLCLSKKYLEQRYITQFSQ